MCGRSGQDGTRGNGRGKATRRGLDCASRQNTRQRYGAGGDAPTLEQQMHFIQRARYAHSSRVFTASEGCAHGLKVALFKEPQEYGRSI